MKKIFFIVGNAHAFHGFFQGQLRFLGEYFKITGIAPEDKYLNQSALKENISVFPIPIEREINPLKDIVSIYKLFKYFKTNKPDAIHGNTPKAAFVSMIAGALAGVPVRIYMCHGLRYEGANGYLRKLLKFIEKLTCCLANNIICVSPSVKQKLISDNIANEKKLSTINYGSVNGVDLDKLNSYTTLEKEDVLTQLDIPKDAFIFSFIGRLVKDKGINELVNSFDILCRKYSHIHLLLIGPDEFELDPITDETKRILRENSHIHLTGWQDDVIPFLKASDVFVFPSYREGLPTSLLEAGALSIPSIATMSTGCRDIIIDGYNGLSIAAPLETSSKQMQDELKAKMEYFINSKEEERMEMGKNARDIVEKKFSRRDIWIAACDFYKDIV